MSNVLIDQLMEAISEGKVEDVEDIILSRSEIRLMRVFGPSLLNYCQL